jgi:hypothetical protein
LKIEDLWMSLRSAVFMISFIIATPKAGIKYTIFTLDELVKSQIFDFYSLKPIEITSPVILIL